MESTKLSARVVAYRDAIKTAREAGVTWGQLSALFGTDQKYFASVCKAMDKSKYKTCEQLPLPEPEKTKTVAIAHNKTVDVKNGNAESRPTQTLEIPKKQDVLTGKEVINQSSNFKML